MICARTRRFCPAAGRCIRCATLAKAVKRADDARWATQRARVVASTEGVRA